MIKREKQKDISAYRAQIEKLSICSSLDNAEIDLLLQNAVIKHCKKGSLLFLAGEKTLYFYVILDGWIKIFSNNPDGCETVLKMARKNYAFSISSVLLHDTFLMNAKITDDAVLLLIPAQILREQIKKNHRLANNLMMGAVNDSREFMHHLSDLVLKNTEERICWFLLNLFLENGEKLTSIQLSYDKSLIASYLGMKPESFSRGLQALRKRGLVAVNKNIITIPNSFSLCDHCDLDSALKCKRHRSSQCPNPQN
ncbi:MAG: hypothetical protein A2887_04225 [Alphaproteobacteria bacterium RIFCSPLOWO2_01_FULL_40_26]|nr:MAG: hypothetical protein A3D15_05535 [Alphaproteobacteria bacterium RIFCSPHIGHO2_02_FULL_40_34]OFW94432.1 MAG: hypothetical protein A2887_04225 [Alphaproteobacteria bacterium RIFCSPLOWO2_01_FULL_40_26]OFX09393.1 MAG: hypothetical protein A3H30_01910 [Alphaproteobacteria bacterium RIFCSPLOWO2_02_FULL_40_19]OFX11325.1 MAG: hypothetical protein A3G22_02765 [Alphaproteobacteria bacterium RIFCSPLOWO2_12_FULL_40_11]